MFSASHISTDYGVHSSIRNQHHLLQTQKFSDADLQNHLSGIAFHRGIHEDYNQTEAQDRLYPNNNEVSMGLDGSEGMIFMSNRQTMKECIQRQLFGHPMSQVSVVELVKPGMKLFLFEYETRKLYGVFEAVTKGGINLEPDAYKWSGGSFPAQVRVRTLWDCYPLSESEFKGAIIKNYFTSKKFHFYLLEEQVENLIRLFSTRKIHSPVPKYFNTRNKGYDLRDMLNKKRRTDDHVTLQVKSGHADNLINEPSRISTQVHDRSGKGSIAGYTEHMKEISSASSKQSSYNAGQYQLHGPHPGVHRERFFARDKDELSSYVSSAYERPVDCVRDNCSFGRAHMQIGYNLEHDSISKLDSLSHMQTQPPHLPVQEDESHCIMNNNDALANSFVNQETVVLVEDGNKMKTETDENNFSDAQHRIIDFKRRSEIRKREKGIEKTLEGGDQKRKRRKIVRPDFGNLLAPNLSFSLDKEVNHDQKDKDIQQSGIKNVTESATDETLQQSPNDCVPSCENDKVKSTYLNDRLDNKVGGFPSVKSSGNPGTVDKSVNKLPRSTEVIHIKGADSSIKDTIDDLIGVLPCASQARVSSMPHANDIWNQKCTEKSIDTESCSSLDAVAMKNDGIPRAWESSMPHRNAIQNQRDTEKYSDIENKSSLDASDKKNDGSLDNSAEEICVQDTNLCSKDIVDDLREALPHTFEAHNVISSQLDESGN